eukprot:c11161_g1_i1 orf=158-718(+)
MEPCERRVDEPKLPTPADAAPPAMLKAVLRLSAPQRQELELVYRQCPRPTSALLQQLIKDRPILSHLDIQLLKAWFQSRRLKEKRDEKLSPLIHKNAELKAEHETLLLLNNQLRNQALLLNLENQRLKEQLERQLQAKQLASSFVLARHDDAKDGESSDVDDGDGGSSCESGICDLETNLCKVKLI